MADTIEDRARQFVAALQVAQTECHYEFQNATSRLVGMAIDALRAERRAALEEAYTLLTGKVRLRYTEALDTAYLDWRAADAAFQQLIRECEEDEARSG